ncbi:MAG: YkgJ family cysteine cluster protein [Bradymonadaceae bacterium]|nr:YkgJ family cysteine cluster protein [Lujinxingiaceae bacterium]
MADENDGPEKRAQALEMVRRLHRAVDLMVAPLEARHRERLQCRMGCSACCVDDLSVFEVEAARIQAEHAELLEQARGRERGGCAFLDEGGACRIYESRPYVCRTQGLPLRWLELGDGVDEVVEFRDICALNETSEPIESLEDQECWTIGLVEQKLSELQQALGSEPERRVALRSLFRRGC